MAFVVSSKPCSITGHSNRLRHTFQIMGLIVVLDFGSAFKN